MSTYATLLAQAHLLALQALIEALKQATDPAEIRRLAQAIFKAPQPDEALDRQAPKPQPAQEPQSPSATSPERSEGSRISELPSPSDSTSTSPPRQPPPPSAPTAPTHNPSPRPGPVAHVPLDRARPRHPLIPHATPASRLLAHSGRAP